MYVRWVGVSSKSNVDWLELFITSAIISECFEIKLTLVFNYIISLNCAQILGGTIQLYESCIFK